MKLEIIRRGANGAGKPGRPALVFVHGSFSGAWVWEPHFLPFFAEQGWDCVAVSLSGHGKSEGADAIDTFGLSHFVTDVAAAADGMEVPPVVIGHSLGGLVAQRFVSAYPTSGQVLMASVPPGGLSGPSAHMASRYPSLVWQIGVLQTLGPQFTDERVFHRALFSADMPEHEAAAVLPKFRHESQLATMQAMAPQMFPVVGGRRVPTLVLGGDSDAFISVADMQATALFHGGELQILKDLPHGVMLDIHWRRAADPILAWLEERWG